MAVYFAPQYRDPNAELKYYMLQMAQMFGTKKAERKQGRQERQRTEAFIKSLSEPQIPTAGGQSVFTPGGARALTEGFLEGRPTQVGAMRGPPPTQIQLVQKALATGYPLGEALGAARLAPGAPATVSPTQQIAGRKLAMINRLEAIPPDKRTKAQQAKLDKMLIGQPLVEIGFGKPAAAAERTAIAETRASIDSLDNLKTLFDNARTKTGLVAGRVAPVAGLFGLTTDEQEAFMAATSAFKNAIIKQITGAQMSEPEAKRIMKQIPDITDPPARWNAKWKQSKKNLEFLQRRRLEILQQSGLRVPIGETAITIPPEIHNMSDEELRRIAGIE